MSTKFAVGDKVIFYSSYPNNPENGDIGVIIRIEERENEVWAKWEMSKREQHCDIGDIRLLTKLEEAMK